MTNDSTNATSSPSLRNLQILEVLGREGRALTPTELNASLNLPKPTIHRLISHLEEQGFLIRDTDGRSYLPGPRYREMALGAMQAYLGHLPSREVLILLNEKIGETCNLSIPDGDAMIYIDRVETKWPLRIALKVGSRVPLHATSAGKVGLSMLPSDIFTKYLSAGRKHAFTQRTIADPKQLELEIEHVRKQGFSTDNEEFVEGMIAVAVPVLDYQQTFRATLSFHAPVQRLKLNDALHHITVMREAAAQLGKFL